MTAVALPDRTPPATASGRLLLAADHDLGRAGLRGVIERALDFEIAGEATTAEEAARLAARVRPQVAVVNLGEDGSDGVRAARLISESSPDTAVLILTLDDRIERFLAALRAGARGVVLESAHEDKIVDAVRAVRGGQVILGPALADRLMTLVAGSDSPALRPFPSLTKREHEVLELLADGAENALIAQRLFLSPKTVRNLVSSICTKLAVSDRLQAALRARDAGMGSARI